MAFDPSSLALSDWRRASYAGSPWAPTSSAGTSGIRGGMAEPTNPATVGASLNGFGTADFDGTAKVLVEDTYFLDQIISTTAWSLSVLVNPTATAATRTVGAGYNDPAICSETTQGYWYLTYTTSGVTIGHYDPTAGVWLEANQACSSGSWHLIHAWFDGSSINISVDGAAPASTASTDQGTTGVGALTFGRAFAAAFFAGLIAESMVAPTDLGATARTNIGSYVQTRYGLSLGFPQEAGPGIARSNGSPFFGRSNKGPGRHMPATLGRQAYEQTQPVFVKLGTSFPRAVGPTRGPSSNGPMRHFRPGTAPAFNQTQQSFLALGSFPLSVSGAPSRDGPRRNFPAILSLVYSVPVGGSTPYTVNINESIAAPTDFVLPAGVYTRGQSENVAIGSDAYAQFLVEVRGITESFGAPADGVTRSQVLSRPLTESVTAPVDGVTRIASLTRAQPENVTLPSDAIARSQGVTRAQPENVTLPSDANTRAATHPRAQPETIGLPADAVTRAQVLSRAQPENVAIPSDANARVQGFLRAQAESVTAISDAHARSLVLARTINENITKVTDATTRASTASRAQPETLAIPSDSVARTLAFIRAINESITAASDSNAHVMAAVRAIAENITKVTDATTRAASFIRAQPENVTLPSDANTRAQVLARAQPETLAIPSDVNSSLVTGHNPTRNMPETLSAPADVVSRSLVEARAQAENITKITDGVARLLAQSRAQAENLVKVTDGNARALVEARAISENVAACTDTITRAAIMARALAENVVKITDGHTRLVALTRSQVETVVIVSDAIARAQTTSRSKTESIAASTDTVGRLLALVRAQPETITKASDVVARAAVFARDNPHALAAPSDLNTNAVHRSNLVANVVESILAPLDVTSRSLVMVRLLNEALALVTDTNLGVHVTGAALILDLATALQLRMLITLVDNVGSTIELSIRTLSTTIALDDGTKYTTELQAALGTSITMSHLDSYDVGDDAEITGTIRRRLTGALVDPTTLVVRVKKPDGLITTMTYDNDVTEHRLVRDPGDVDRGLTPIGVFIATIDCDQVGDYIVEWTTTGEGKGREPTTFHVRTPRIPL